MKPECDDYQPKIPAYCMGDVPAEEKQRMETHLASCPSCRSELEAYERLLGRLAMVEDEEVPRHFFVYPEVRTPGFWQLFQRKPRLWQAALAGVSAFLLMIGLAGISRLQIRSDASGWEISFGGGSIDTVALKKEILEAAAIHNRAASIEWTSELKREIARSWSSMSKQQQAEFTAALGQMNSRLAAQIKNSEGQVKDDTRILVADLYRAVAQQRAKDLETINLRLDSADANNALKARQTNEILGTLLQVADLKFR